MKFQNLWSRYTLPWTDRGCLPNSTQSPSPTELWFQKGPTVFVKYVFCFLLAEEIHFHFLSFPLGSKEGGSFLDHQITTPHTHTLTQIHPNMVKEKSYLLLRITFSPAFAEQIYSASLRDISSSPRLWWRGAFMDPQTCSPSQPHTCPQNSSHTLTPQIHTHEHATQRKSLC